MYSLFMRQTALLHRVTAHPFEFTPVLGLARQTLCNQSSIGALSLPTFKVSGATFARLDVVARWLHSLSTQPEQQQAQLQQQSKPNRDASTKAARIARQGGAA